MIKLRRTVTFVIVAIMGLTCMVPMADYSFASGNTTTQATQTTATTATKPTNPFAGHKGWVRYKGKRYFIKNNYPIKGIHKINKEWYEFNKSNGIFIRKIGDDMDKKAQKYKSRKKYLVVVSYKKHRVRIYKGKKNNWKRIKNFKCSMGKKSTPTPRGTFKITNKGRYFNTGSRARCWYWTGFIGNIYLFHSVLYNRNSRPNHVIDGRLGRNISHGCIRLSLKNAKWIYKNVPRRSKVVIY